jgi:hypothetical protein
MLSLTRHAVVCLTVLVAAACGDGGTDPAAPGSAESPRLVPRLVTGPLLSLSSTALYYCDRPGSTRNCVVLKHGLRITSTVRPLRWTASKDRSWIVLSAAKGITPTAITISVNPRLLPPFQLGSGTVTIAAAGATNSPQVVRVIVNFTARPP